MDHLAVPDKPRLAPGVRLVGEMQESAFVKPPWLIERQGEGYLQVPRPLYGVAEQANGERTLSEIADEVRRADGIGLSADNVRYLIATQLIPNGVVPTSEGNVVATRNQARSALAITRLKTIDPHALAGITGALRLLYWPPVLLVVLGLAAVVQFWVYVVHGVGSSLHDAFYTPAFMLIMLLSVVVAAGFHELGHAAALRYGGGTPRSFGFGMYLMYPVFFTDVSDNYRLRRWARVRTDLGGFYFNLIFALLVFGAYVLTRQEALLVVILVMNFEIVRQLLPFVRLDGYWTLADVTGIPDFLSKMGAFVLSMLPWERGGSRPSMPPLKWWARWVFALYVLVTVPALALLFVLMVRSVPRVLATAFDALGQQANAFLQARDATDVLTMAGAIGQSLLIVLPVAGLLFSLYKLGRAALRAGLRWSAGSRRRRSVVGAAALASGLAVLAMWLPQIPWPRQQPNPLYAPGTFQPIGPDERLSVSDAIAGYVVSRSPDAELPGWLPRLIATGARAGAVTPDVGSHGAPPPPAPPPSGGGAAPAVGVGGATTTSTWGATTPSGAPNVSGPVSNGSAAPGTDAVAAVSGAAAPAVPNAEISSAAGDAVQSVAPVAPAGDATAGAPAANAVSAVSGGIATAVPNANVSAATGGAVQAVGTAVPAVGNAVPAVGTAVPAVGTSVPSVPRASVNQTVSGSAAVQQAPTTVAGVAGSAASTAGDVATAVPTVVSAAPTAVASVIDTASTPVATAGPAPSAVETAVATATTAEATAVQPIAAAVPTAVQPVATAEATAVP